MRHIILVVCLVLITNLPNYIQFEEGDNLLDYKINANYLSDNNIIVTFSNSDKIFRNSMSSNAHSYSEFQLLTQNIDSFISILKINSMLMTIKYGSTLILSPKFPNKI